MTVQLRSVFKKTKPIKTYALSFRILQVVINCYGLDYYKILLSTCCSDLAKLMVATSQNLTFKINFPSYKKEVFCLIRLCRSKAI